MKGSLNYIVPFVILVSILLPLSSCDLITFTCKNTPKPKLCETLLRSHPKSSGADITGLGLILVDAVKEKSMKAVRIITYLLNKKHEWKNPLTDCKEKYEFVGDSDVNVANDALHFGNPKFGVDSMNDAAIETQICKDGFKKSPPILINVNNDMIDTAHVASAVIRLLE